MCIRDSWWSDAPSGAGVFKAKAPPHAPPQLGWVALGEYAGSAPPALVAATREVKAVAVE